MSEPILPGDAKVYGAASIAVLIVTAAIREWFKARNGKSGLLSGMAIVQAEDLAATTSIRKQLTEENARMSLQIAEKDRRLDSLSERVRTAEETISALLRHTHECHVSGKDCPARTFYEETRLSGKWMAEEGHE